MEKTISIYEALRLRDNYKEDLTKLLGSQDGKLFVVAGIQGKDTINGVPLETITKKLQSNYDKTCKLLENISLLTRAINVSNATTTITIAGKEYIVADAMAKAKTMDLEITWYRNIANNLAVVNKDISKYNSEHLSPEAIDAYLDKMQAGVPESVRSEKEQLDTYRKGWEEDYRKNNTKILVDPYDLLSKVDSIYEDINDFNTQYNIELTKSNLQTMITVNLG